VSTTTKLHVIRREVDATTADGIKRALTHARVAGLLESYDDDAFWDGTEIMVMLSAERMHPSDRDNFACEREVADRVVAKAIARHRGPSERPKAG
jgi:hypothetical protein